MKAIVKTRPELGVEIIDAPMPRPGPDQILVRVAACGICGSDLHIYLWELGADRALSRMPAVIGHEPAGEVVELGAGVTAFKVGDHVALDPFGPCGKCSLCQSGRFNFCKNPGRLGGAFAEYCVAPVENAWLVPQSMDLEEAALLEPFATGLHAVEISDLKAGGGCVIEGPGPIGLSAALSARAMGCTSIVVTGLAQDAERLALVRDMGFKAVCAGDRDWTDQVRALMPPDGADVVFDAAGFQDSVLKLVRRGGELVELGWPARDVPSAEMRALFFHGVRILPSRVRVADTWRHAIALVSSGAVKLKQMVTHRYNIEGGIEAFELLRAKQGLKALIMPQGL